MQLSVLYKYNKIYYIYIVITMGKNYTSIHNLLPKGKYLLIGKCYKHVSFVCDAVD